MWAHGKLLSSITRLPVLLNILLTIVVAQIGTTPVTANPVTANPVTANPAGLASSAQNSAQSKELIGQRITVQQFKVHGSTIFDAWELSNITQPFEDQTLTLAELQTAADAVTQYYFDRGYLTSRAILGDQTIENGVVHIQVIEGQLEGIELTGNKRVNSKYIREQINLAGSPLNQENLENQLRLLKTDPLIGKLEASLKEGTRLGQTQLSLKITEANPSFASINLDNYGSPSIGSRNLTASLGTRNLTGNRDSLLASLTRSNTGGSNLLNLSYQRILNPQQGTLLLRVAPSRYRITEAGLQDLDITGASNLYEIVVRQPLIHRPNTELALSVGMVKRSGQTLISDFLTNSNATTVLRFGQDWLRRDSGGLWIAQSQFNLGTTQRENHPSGDRQTPFFSWTGTVQRIQQLSKNHTLIANLGWQLSPDRLPSSQQFNFGGGQSLRGFPLNAFGGDNGLTFSLENQFTLKRDKTGDPMLQISPFLDMAASWNQSDTIASEKTRDVYTSIGVGVTWQPLPKWSLRVDAALPLNAVESGRTLAIYFNSNYRF